MAWGCNRKQLIALFLLPLGSTLTASCISYRTNCSYFVSMANDLRTSATALEPQEIAAIRSESQQDKRIQMLMEEERKSLREIKKVRTRHLSQGSGDETLDKKFLLSIDLLEEIATKRIEVLRASLAHGMHPKDDPGLDKALDKLDIESKAFDELLVQRGCKLLDK